MKEEFLKQFLLYLAQNSTVALYAFNCILTKEKEPQIYILDESLIK